MLHPAFTIMAVNFCIDLELILASMAENCGETSLFVISVTICDI